MESDREPREARRAAVFVSTSRTSPRRRSARSTRRGGRLHTAGSSTLCPRARRRSTRASRQRPTSGRPTGSAPSSETCSRRDRGARRGRGAARGRPRRGGHAGEAVCIRRRGRLGERHLGQDREGGSLSSTDDSLSRAEELLARLEPRAASSTGFAQEEAARRSGRSRSSASCRSSRRASRGARAREARRRGGCRTVLTSCVRSSRILSRASSVWRVHGQAESVRYSLDVGGKRVRPVICLATAEAAGATRARRSGRGCARADHTFSLVHDDLPALDGDEERGPSATWKQFGEAVGILRGDALHAEAFRLAGVVRDDAYRTRARAGDARDDRRQYLDINGTDDEVALHKLKDRLPVRRCRRARALRAPAPRPKAGAPSTRGFDVPSSRECVQIWNSRPSSSRTRARTARPSECARDGEPRARRQRRTGNRSSACAARPRRRCR